ncbi:kinase-like domain-containing protein [Syncephalis plumigaleata]|nr:kinase-like domain-containing protein [Syncephalis plumigaleata]
MSRITAGPHGTKLLAVKEIFRTREQHHFSDRQFSKIVAAEFCIQSTLRHAHLVPVLDLVRLDADHWCQILEYCPNGDLFARIRKQTINPGEAGRILYQTLRGIAYMHAKGVAHRDIKPENILFDNEDRVKIADFGSAEVFKQCWEKQISLTRGQAGSRPYMAPETFNDQWHDARKADIWSCGIVYVTMLCGRNPWQQAKSTDDATYRSYEQNYPTWSKSTLKDRSCSGLAFTAKIPNAEAAELVTLMLAPNPEDRPHAHTLLEHAYFRQLGLAPPVKKTKHRSSIDGQ